MRLDVLGMETKRKRKMKRLNWKCIRSNISEARLALQDLEMIIARSGTIMEFSHPPQRSLEQLEVSLRHAYHHLNFAWNIRYIKTAKYRSLTDSDFKKWGKFPPGFDCLNPAAALE
jgi:hypothetical protein